MPVPDNNSVNIYDLPIRFYSLQSKDRLCVMLRAQNYVLSMLRGRYWRSSQRYSGVIIIYA